VLNHLIIKHICHPGILYFVEKHNIQLSMTSNQFRELIASNKFINLNAYERYMNEKIKINSKDLLDIYQFTEGSIHIDKLIYWTTRVNDVRPDFSPIIVHSSAIKHRKICSKIIKAYHQGLVNLDVSEIIEMIFAQIFVRTSRQSNSFIENVETLKEIIIQTNYRGGIKINQRVESRLTNFQMKIFHEFVEWHAKR